MLGLAPDGGRGGKEQQIFCAEVRTLKIWLAQINSPAPEEENRR